MADSSKYIEVSVSSDGTNGSDYLNYIRTNAGSTVSVQVNFPNLKSVLYDSVQGGGDDKHLPVIGDITCTISAAGDPSAHKVSDISLYSTGSIYFYARASSSPYLIDIKFRIHYYPFMYARPEYIDSAIGNNYTNTALPYFKYGPEKLTFSNFYKYDDCLPSTLELGYSN